MHGRPSTSASVAEPVALDVTPPAGWSLGRHVAIGGSSVVHQVTGAHGATAILKWARWGDADTLRRRAGDAAALAVCRASEDLAVCRRKADRYDMVKYRNIRLNVGNTRFRVGDLSNGGLRIVLTGVQNMKLFPLGRAIRGDDQPLVVELGVGDRRSRERAVDGGVREGSHLL